MKIIVPVKIVPDDQDIQVAADGSLDYSKAKPTISTYDLNAIEAAAQLAGADGSVVVISVGPKSIDDSKTKKGILARGVSELYMAADDSLAGLDAFATASALAALVAEVGEYDLILCGDGSADNYAQQTDVQLACRLGLPVVNAACKIEAADGGIKVESVLEDTVETVICPLPAVVSVCPDIAVPRIPGKKPMHAVAAAAEPSAIEVLEVKAPEQADRKQEIMDASDDNIAKFVAAIKAAL